MKVSYKFNKLKKILNDEIDFYAIGVLDYSSFTTFLKDTFFNNEENLELKIKKLEKQLNGLYNQFAFVADFDEYIILASDLIRTYPVFYNIEGKIQISDNLNSINHKSINKNNVSSFVFSGYAFGSNTIYNNTYGLQAAEIICINKVTKSVLKKRYFSFAPVINKIDINISRFVSDFNIKIGASFIRMIKSLPDVKNWIIPLSGGHDSRQIINTLYKLGVKNVICFSYGKSKNTQAIISERVAKAVGYDWHFVEYTEEKWGKLHELGLIDEYIDFAFQGVSTPHLQDFLAVYELNAKGVIDVDDIFVPGHTLDMISGGHFSNLDIACKTKEDALLRTGKRHSKLNDENSVKKSSLYDALSQIYNKANVKPQYFQENVNWQERQAKFIVNSCRVYEFFGFDFCLPFWDKDLVEFFLGLPPEQRLQRKFFLQAERQSILIPELSDIPFEDEIKPKPTKKGKSLSSTIKALIPDELRSNLVRIFGARKYEAESLNQIYAMKGKTVGDFLGPLNHYPEETHNFLKPIFLRPPYRVNFHLLSAIYAISKLNNNHLK
ncbi:MAG: asparagine synthase C-terminal domain-containing protein [Flavobacteriaceae bacterium]|nr:asparagine synthase C-terminal domain-containing protein [Flavobacteriaceae bacterium]